MPPEPDDVTAVPAHGTDCDVPPFWAGGVRPEHPDDAEVPLGEQPVRGPDDTDEFVPIDR